MRLSGCVCFEKNLSNKDSSFVPSDEDKADGGSVYVTQRENLMKKRGGC